MSLSLIGCLTVKQPIKLKLNKRHNLNLRSGSQRHRHFAGFFNVPVQALTRAILFIRLFRENAPCHSAQMPKIRVRAITLYYHVGCKKIFHTKFTYTKDAS